MKLNTLQIIGRIGQDAKVVEYNNRKFVAFSVAVDESYKDAHGTKIERATWYDCTTEQERFFKVLEWLKKGREVFVEGRPQARAYQDTKSGHWLAAIRINVQNLSLGHSPHDQPRPAAVAAPAPAPVAIGQGSDPNDDLPF